MNDPKSILHKWFLERYEEFGNKVPNPNKIDRITELVDSHFNTTLKNYIGQGTNGIAFRTNDGDVVKYTIDSNEALLWARLKGKDLPGITVLKDVIHLSSSQSDNAYVYVIKVEFVPHPVSNGQSKLIRQATKNAYEQIQIKLSQAKVNDNPKAHSDRRALELVSAFQKVAQTDPSFKHIPDMIIDLADKFQGFIYDLQPDNFRVNDDGVVVLVDPSVPNLFGDNHDAPRDVVYEAKLTAAIYCKTITI